MSELRACPFCVNSKPEVQEMGCGGIASLWFVTCLNCSSRGPHQCEEKQAVDAWNRLPWNQRNEKSNSSCVRLLKD